MDQSLQQDPLRMTPEEAEAVIGRFREQEEAFHREMEARASMPTVKDLAEGLDVPPERVEMMLQEVRGQAQATAPNGVPSQAAMNEVGRQNRSAWLIGVALLAVVLSLGFIALLFMNASPEPPTPPPPTTDTQPVLADPGAATTAPEPGTAGRY